MPIFSEEMARSAEGVQRLNQQTRNDSGSKGQGGTVTDLSAIAQENAAASTEEKSRQAFGAGPL